MEIRVYNKDYFKQSEEVKRSILFAVRNLFERIYAYEQQNISFEKIFNDERVKYDKHGEFYTFKYQHNSLQLRILYLYFVVDEKPCIVIVDFYVKKRNNKKYIKHFEKFKLLKAEYVYQNSRNVA